MTSQYNFIEEVNYSVQDGLTNSNNIDRLQFSNMAPWEKSKHESSAEDLFYLGMIAKFDLGMFSKQTMILYENTSKEKGIDYAAAIFLILLPKVKSNPTSYIFNAIKGGAEPTNNSLYKVKKMRQILGRLPRTTVTKDVKQQMQEALDQGSIKTLSQLVQEYDNYTKAMQLLSWQGTLDTLIEGRKKFITFLLQ